MKMKIHHEGRNILLVSFLILGGINFLLFHFQAMFALRIVLFFSVILYLLMVNFFRSPRRHFPGEMHNTVVAPADGKIVVIEEVMENEFFKEKRLMISIFMNVFNVHANWFPVNGKVLHVDHHNGAFMKAYLPKASTENERSMVVIETPQGDQVMARQIAGALARRIVTYAEKGDECHIDEHMGFIKFGSRVDIYLPVGTKVCVEMDQVVTGNQTVIAKLNS
ncbi:MAG: phosphatidylserine decarboxylase family protein [Bacteroidales bacterium]